MQNSLWRAYSYAWITLAFFAFSLFGHWLFGWFAFVQEQAEHGQPVEFFSLPDGNAARHVRELAV